MSGLYDPILENAKILMIGDQGEGKTGAKAALVAMGYKLRMIDTDNGFKILRGLLTSDHYPYKRWMEKTNVKPEENISFKQIEVPMGFKTWEEKDKGGRVLFTRDVLAPTSSNAWAEVVKLLKGDWKEDGKNFGPIHEWDNDTILDFDTMSTLAEIAKYWIQDLNGHLGALTDEHGRDTGGAQEMIMRMLNLVLNANVRSNVIITGHIKRIDMTGDIPQSPEARLRAQKSVEAKGFPAVIGQAVGPYIGKKFNDQFVVKRESEGRGAERRIYTVPVANTNTKNSVWLEDSYPLSTGLAEIFAALRYQPHPTEFVEFVRGKAKPSGEAAAPNKFGGFGR